MVNRIVDCFQAGKILIALIFLAAVAGFTVLIPKLGFHIELHSLLKSDSKQKGSDLGAFYRTFPPVEGEAKIAVSFDRPVTVADLIKTREWVAELEDLPEVKRVISTFDSLLETKYGEFTLEEWVELAGTENDPVTLGTSPGVNFVHGTFISKDFQSLAFYIQRARTGFGEFMDALRDTSAGWGDKTRVMSLNFMLLEGRDLLKKELSHLLLLLLIALFLLLPLILRSFRTAFLPLGIALFSVMTFMSILVLFDQPITLVLIAAPILVMVIGLSNSIHLQRYFDSARSRGATVRQALVKMFQDGGMACFMTSLTTAIGFFSLLIVSHEEIRGFGFWCGIGVLISYINIILFFPVLLSFIPGKIKPNRTYAFANPARLRKYVVPVTVGLLLLVGGIAFVRLDTSLYEEMPQNNEAVRDMQWFSEHFKGTERIEIEVKGPLNQLEVFNSVDRLKDELGQLGGIEGVSSYVSLLRYISPPGLLDTEGLPIALRALRSLPEYPENLLTRKENHGCIVFHISDRFGSAQFKKFKERFDELQPDLSSKAEFRINGYVSMAYDSINYIAESLLYSLGISIGFITLALIIYLRSAPLAIICLIPNVLPIMVTLGLAGWLQIPVSVGMIVIFMIGLGIAVDDTVHLVIKFLQSRKKNASDSIREHLDEAVSSTGFAIFLTSIVILAAAVTFLQSSFSTLRETGIVLSTVTIAAILADLFVFPCIIEKYYQVVLRLKKTQ